MSAGTEGTVEGSIFRGLPSKQNGSSAGHSSLDRYEDIGRSAFGESPAIRRPQPRRMVLGWGPRSNATSATPGAAATAVSLAVERNEPDSPPEPKRVIVNPRLVIERKPEFTDYLKVKLMAEFERHSQNV